MITPTGPCRFPAVLEISQEAFKRSVLNHPLLNPVRFDHLDAIALLRWPRYRYARIQSRRYDLPPFDIHFKAAAGFDKTFIPPNDPAKTLFATARPVPFHRRVDWARQRGLESLSRTPRFDAAWRERKESEAKIQHEPLNWVTRRGLYPFSPLGNDITFPKSGSDVVRLKTISNSLGPSPGLWPRHPVDQAIFDKYHTDPPKDAHDPRFFIARLGRCVIGSAFSPTIVAESRLMTLPEVGPYSLLLDTDLHALLYTYEFIFWLRKFVYGPYVDHHSVLDEDAIKRVSPASLPPIDAVELLQKLDELTNFLLLKKPTALGHYFGRSVLYRPVYRKLVEAILKALAIVAPTISDQLWAALWMRFGGIDSLQDYPKPKTKDVSIQFYPAPILVHEFPSVDYTDYERIKRWHECRSKYDCPGIHLYTRNENR